MGMGIELLPLDVQDEKHVQFMFEVRTAPEVAKNLLGDPPPNLEVHKKYLHSQLHKRHIYLICDTRVESLNPADPPVKRLVGYCQIYNIQESMPQMGWEGSLEVGWCIHPEFHGKHYGSASIKLLLEKCNLIYPGKDIDLFVKVDNVKALILYLKHGFFILSLKDGVINMSTQKRFGQKA